MALDLAKMRAKYQKLRSKGGGNKDIFWRPQDGEQTIRILPTPDGDPFKEYWFHYNLGKNPGFLSPKKNFGETDPLDSFIRNLFDEGSEDSIKMAKNLMARQRFFSPVIVRGEEDKGVRLWGYGKTVYETLLGLVLNPDYGDITDPTEGTDLTLVYGKPPGAQFPQTKLQPRRKTSPILTDSTQMSEVLETEIDWDGIFTKKTPDEVQVMLDEWLGSDDADKGEEVVKYDSSSQSADAGSSAVEAAFKDLMS
tara:strand:- start:3359 stop:4114 length:756 start_codon:yes stop_codon:yes gene_type:complete